MTQTNMLAGLFWGPFLHEDAAILAAAWMVEEKGLPWLRAFLAVFGGMVASGSALYALGAAARHVPGLRRRLVGPQVARMQERLRQNLGAAVMLCHLVPGILPAMFVACGLSGVPYRRFLGRSVLAAAAYPAAALPIILTCNQVLRGYLGTWSWPVIALIMAVLAVRNRLKPAMIGRHFTGGARPARQPSARHEGMPPLPGLSSPRTALAEHFPAWLFYAPLGIRWLILGMRHRCLLLPTVANPAIKMAGLWGESKGAVMNQIAPEFHCWVAPFALLTRSSGGDLAPGELERALARMKRAGVDFPVVAKPDCSWQGYGVRRLETAAALRSYLEAYPGGEMLLLQKIIDWDGEAGVFYVRHPGEERGRIESLTLRYFPFVIGNGVSTVRELVDKDERASFKRRLHLGWHQRHVGAGSELLDRVPASGETVRLSFIGSIRVGGLYYDAQAHVTPALTERFDAICRSMPEFHFGRLDIRFKSLDQLEKGEDFAIIEINGAGSEAIHVWDPRKPLREVYRDLFRFQSTLFEISARNRARGFRPAGLAEFLKETWHYRSLLLRYPPSG